MSVQFNSAPNTLVGYALRVILLTGHLFPCKESNCILTRFSTVEEKTYVTT